MGKGCHEVTGFKIKNYILAKTLKRRGVVLNYIFTKFKLFVNANFGHIFPIKSDKIQTRKIIVVILITYCQLSFSFRLPIIATEWKVYIYFEYV